MNTRVCVSFGEPPVQVSPGSSTRVLSRTPLTRRDPSRRRGVRSLVHERKGDDRVDSSTEQRWGTVTVQGDGGQVYPFDSEFLSFASPVPISRRDRPGSELEPIQTGLGGTRKGFLGTWSLESSGYPNPGGSEVRPSGPRDLGTKGRVSEPQVET